MSTPITLRHDYSSAEIMALFALPFNDLLYQAHTVHREYFPGGQIQVSTLLSVKTGKCPEDCKYCPQSAHYATGLKTEPLMAVAEVASAARKAKEAGATRFCMGAAWRNLNDRDMETVSAMISEVKALGLESCGTFGMVTEAQAASLKAAGLDYYNHNLDTSQQHYKEIITTRTYQDRLDTLSHIRNAGLKTCCGGIVGLGEKPEDRAELLRTLANLPEHPESVPINLLVQVEGTPLSGTEAPHIIDFIRTIAVARILMPASYVRLSAGRESMSDEAQALCFFAGANSIFYGEKLLTTGNPATTADRQLFARLGLTLEGSAGEAGNATSCAAHAENTANTGAGCADAHPSGLAA